MIKNIHLKDFTIFDSFEWEHLSNVNLVIGENDTGKSNLLRLLYAVTRSVQESGQRHESTRWKDILARKLQWTFQPPGLELGKIVRKGERRLNVHCEIGLSDIKFEFGSSTTKQINDAVIEPQHPSFGVYTLFFPPKEILTTQKAIAATREAQEIIGFGDTYLDLVKALRQPETQGEIELEMKSILSELDRLFPGHIRQREDGEFEYRRGPGKYEMTQTAEGIKKIGSLAHLIRNKQVQRGSILFFDEPSANLHPSAILDFVKLLFEMSLANVQIFVATHSYVVLKQFELLAREHGEAVPLCVFSASERDGVNARFADLRDRIPQNSIVDASVNLFERDLDLSMDRSQ